MKKYIITASLFALNTEIISWLALLAIVVMGAIDFFIAVDKAKEERWK